MTAAEATLHEWMTASDATESTGLSATSILDSPNASFAGGLEYTEQGANGIAETARRETGESEPSAQWSFQTANLPKLPILEELCLSEEDLEDQLEFSTRKLSLTRIQETPPVPEAPGPVDTVLREPK